MTGQRLDAFPPGSERVPEGFEEGWLERLARALSRRWRGLLRRLSFGDPCNGLPTPRDLTASVDGDKIKLTFQTDVLGPGDPGFGGVSFEQRVDGGPWQYVFVYGSGNGGNHETYDWFWAPFDANGVAVAGEVCYRAYQYEGNSLYGTKGCYSNTACVDLGAPSLPVPVNLSLAFVSEDWGTYTYRVRLDWTAEQAGVDHFEVLGAFYSNNGHGVPAGIDPSMHVSDVNVTPGAAGLAPFFYEHDVPLNAGMAFAVRAVSASGAVGAKSNVVGMEAFEGF